MFFKTILQLNVSTVSYIFIKHLVHKSCQYIFSILRKQIPGLESSGIIWIFVTSFRHHCVSTILRKQVKSEINIFFFFNILDIWHLFMIVKLVTNFLLSLWVIFMLRAKIQKVNWLQNALKCQQPSRSIPYNQKVFASPKNIIMEI